MPELYPQKHRLLRFILFYSARNGVALQFSQQWVRIMGRLLRKRVVASSKASRVRFAHRLMPRKRLSRQFLKSLWILSRLFRRMFRRTVSKWLYLILFETRIHEKWIFRKILFRLNDLVLKILLPVKKLAQFLCVSKIYWSDQSFFYKVK